MGSCGEQALRYLDEERRKDSERKRSIEGKRRRKKNRKKRSTDTNAAEDGAYGPQAEREEVTALQAVPTPAAALANAEYSGTLDATIPMPSAALVCPSLPTVARCPHPLSSSPPTLARRVSSPAARRRPPPPDRCCARIWSTRAVTKATRTWTSRSSSSAATCCAGRAAS